MTYQVKEVYYTLQGEGFHSGRSAVFLRFAGCNLWSGREADRSTAVCQFCDTDFVGTNGPGGGKFATPTALAAAVANVWQENTQSNGVPPFVVCTGGEPLLQMDEPLIDALHTQGFKVAVETNGTIAAPAGLDWICVSPKANADLVLDHGNELKLVYPQIGSDPSRFTQMSFDHFFLQPMDGNQQASNTQDAVEYCKRHPRWRLSVQTHKVLGLP